MLANEGDRIWSDWLLLTSEIWSNQPSSASSQLHFFKQHTKRIYGMNPISIRGIFTDVNEKWKCRYRCDCRPPTASIAKIRYNTICIHSFIWISLSCCHVMSCHVMSFLLRQTNMKHETRTSFNFSSYKLTFSESWMGVLRKMLRDAFTFEFISSIIIM